MGKKALSNEKGLSFRVPLASVGRAEVGVVFEVAYSDPSDKLGELTVSQGGLRWKVGAGYPRFMTWEKLAAVMLEQPRAPKLRRRVRV